MTTFTHQVFLFNNLLNEVSLHIFASMRWTTSASSQSLNCLEKNALCIAHNILTSSYKWGISFELTGLVICSKRLMELLVHSTTHRTSAQTRLWLASSAENCALPCLVGGIDTLKPRMSNSSFTCSNPLSNTKLSPEAKNELSQGSVLVFLRMSASPTLPAHSSDGPKTFKIRPFVLTNEHWL